jgi:hypothetical protein
MRRTMENVINTNIPKKQVRQSLYGIAIFLLIYLAQAPLLKGFMSYELESGVVLDMSLYFFSGASLDVIVVIAKLLAGLQLGPAFLFIGFFMILICMIVIDGAFVDPNNNGKGRTMMSSMYSGLAVVFYYAIGFYMVMIAIKHIAVFYYVLVLNNAWW